MNKTNTPKEENTFVLDGTRYEIDTMPDRGRNILHLISDIKQKTEFEIQVSELAIDRLTSELKTMIDDFTSVEDKEDEDVVEGE